MKQVTDAGAIAAAVDAIIAANPDKVAQAQAKPSMLGWFVGQVMKADRRQGQSASRQRAAESEARHLKIESRLRITSRDSQVAARLERWRRLRVAFFSYTRIFFVRAKRP